MAAALNPDPPIYRILQPRLEKAYHTIGAMVAYEMYRDQVDSQSQSVIQSLEDENTG